MALPHYPHVVVFIVVGVLAVILAGAAFVFFTSLYERQHLAGDVEPVTEPYPYPPSLYWKITRDTALKIGLRHCGDYATKKGTSIVKGLESLFVNTDGTMIVSIVSGSAAGAKLKRTLIRSKFQSGRILESSDISGTEDFSGVAKRAVLLYAGLEELIGFHAKRIARESATPVAFNTNAVLAEWDSIALQRGERWVLLGLARWVDPQQTTIRLTLRGALKQVRVFFRQISKVSEQQHRTHIRRAGSRMPD